MSFQHPADWTPLRAVEPPAEAYCVVLRTQKRGGQMIFTGWLAKDESGRMWWWSTLKHDGKSLANGVSTKLFRAVKATDFWFRLAQPIGLKPKDASPPERLCDSYFDSLDAAYRKRLKRSYARRLASMRSKAHAPDSLEPAAATGHGKTH